MNRIRDMLAMALSNEALFQKLNLNALLSEWMKANELDPDLFISQEESMESPLVQQFAQMVEQRFAQMEQQLQEFGRQLPSLALGSELEAEERQAKIEKLKAETEKIQSDIINAGDKVTTERAKAIADIQAKSRQNERREQETR